MFEAGIPSDSRARNCTTPASAPSTAVLRTATEQLVAMPPASRPPVLMALHIWALSHGIASLFGRGDSARRAPSDELLEAAVLVYLRGLGVLPGSRRFRACGRLLPLDPLTRRRKDSTYVNVINIHWSTSR